MGKRKRRVWKKSREKWNGSFQMDGIVGWCELGHFVLVLLPMDGQSMESGTIRYGIVRLSVSVFLFSDPSHQKL
jgi:hypothetical protein